MAQDWLGEDLGTAQVSALATFKETEVQCLWSSGSWADGLR